MIVMDAHEVAQAHCSDCGREAQGLTPAFDHHTSSEVALCPSCLAALHERDQFLLGCCG